MKTYLNSQISMISNKLLALFLMMILVAQAHYLLQTDAFQMIEAFKTFLGSLAAIALIFLAVSLFKFYKNIDIKIDKAFETFKNGGF